MTQVQLNQPGILYCVVVGDFCTHYILYAIIIHLGLKKHRHHDISVTILLHVIACNILHTTRHYQIFTIALHRKQHCIQRYAHETNIILFPKFCVNIPPSENPSSEGNLA